jgi:SAM-dependent methyltransferase
METSLKDVVDEIEKYITLQPNDTVVDIGCNDGTLFKYFKTPLTKIGFDPALNIKQDAESNCDFFINDYFPSDDVAVKARLITAIAMFYDLPDPVKFVSAIKTSLLDDGIFVIQFTDLLSMLQVNAFDNICFEHLEYYTIQNVVDILQKVNMVVFHISRNKVNGGSVRIFACNPGKYAIQESVETEINNESNFFRDNTIEKFSKKVASIKNNVKRFLNTCPDTIIYGLGASTKGNTLLQYFNITPTTIHKIAEVNQDKFGKYTLGSRIPIVSQDIALKDNPEIFFVLPWHFIDTFIEDFDEYLKDGGVLFVPLPEPGLYFFREQDGILFMPIKDILGG